jgi:ketosteroid isomerase-like protein
MTQNVESVKAVADALFSGDADSARARYTNDAVAHFASAGAFSGTYRGADEIFGSFLPRLYEATNGTLKFDSPIVAGDRDFVFLLYQASRERGDQKLSQRHISVARMADGKIKETWFFTEDGVALNAFLS